MFRTRWRPKRLLRYYWTTQSSTRHPLIFEDDHGYPQYHEEALDSSCKLSHSLTKRRVEDPREATEGMSEKKRRRKERDRARGKGGHIHHWDGSRPTAAWRGKNARIPAALFFDVWHRVSAEFVPKCDTHGCWDGRMDVLEDGTFVTDPSLGRGR